jgi:uncharacterized protein YbaP (TraB family)
MIGTYDLDYDALSLTIIHWDLALHEVSGDKKFLDEILQDLLNESDEASAFLDEFIVQRNKKWLPIIIDKSKNKSCFVAVGSGHLGGKDGLISLFQQAGFIVSPITF